MKGCPQRRLGPLGRRFITGMSGRFLSTVHCPDSNGLRARAEAVPTWPNMGFIVRSGIDDRHHARPDKAHSHRGFGWTSVPEAISGTPGLPERVGVRHSQALVGVHNVVRNINVVDEVGTPGAVAMLVVMQSAHLAQDEGREASHRPDCAPILVIHVPRVAVGNGGDEGRVARDAYARSIS